ncbi:MAG: hypothetical protein MHPSP_000438, partial [Paramarteilia canceri]
MVDQNNLQCNTGLVKVAEKSLANGDKIKVLCNELFDCSDKSVECIKEVAQKNIFDTKECKEGLEVIYKLFESQEDVNNETWKFACG